MEKRSTKEARSRSGSILSWESSQSLRWRSERVDLRSRLYILAIYMDRLSKLNPESTKKNLLSGVWFCESALRPCRNPTYAPTSNQGCGITADAIHAVRNNGRPTPHPPEFAGAFNTNRDLCGVLSLMSLWQSSLATVA